MWLNLHLSLKILLLPLRILSCSVAANAGRVADVCELFELVQVLLLPNLWRGLMSSTVHCAVARPYLSSCFASTATICCC